MQLYSGQQFSVATKHQKGLYLDPVFSRITGALLIEAPVDTDQLGTFTGEIERQGTMLECARRKCIWGMQALGCDYGLATEGSFGPHPSIPFLAAHTEILIFIDQIRGLEIYEQITTVDTNYQHSTVRSFDELLAFAVKIGFPSHALIISTGAERSFIKGIQTLAELKIAYNQCVQQSIDGTVFVQTDMRAHLNPTRQSAIRGLGERLAQRLISLCPGCNMPGWPQVTYEYGLLCKQCQRPTPERAYEVNSCVKCSFQTRSVVNSQGANPEFCLNCNP